MHRVLIFEGNHMHLVIITEMRLHPFNTKHVCYLSLLLKRERKSLSYKSNSSQIRLIQILAYRKPFVSERIFRSFSTGQSTLQRIRNPDSFCRSLQCSNWPKFMVNFQVNTKYSLKSQREEMKKKFID